MATKLTLSVSEEVSKMAHELAKTKATSISKLFSEFIKVNTKKYQALEDDLHPLVKEYSGKYHVPKGVNPKKDKEWLREQKAKKHGV
jgi:hypothetical protein